MRIEGQLLRFVVLVRNLSRQKTISCSFVFFSQSKQLAENGRCGNRLVQEGARSKSSESLLANYMSAF